MDSNLPVKPLPDSPKLKKLIGPSFIILGLGLGSGEIILWPYLTANYGMGIIWGAVIGITFQFFMNMEIERYALVKGESVFVGFFRKTKWLTLWFLLSTFVPWVWPGIISASATIFSRVFGFTNPSVLAIGLLILIGAILSLGPVLYKTVESMQKILICISVPSTFLLSILLANLSDWIEVAKGVVGIGQGYWGLPVGIPLASFLAALAYAGAGGNLNLAQSFYIKEKGYGMGKYAGRITSILTGKDTSLQITGSDFETTPENITRFKAWWKNINIEHFVIFWLTGTITIVLLGLLSFSTTFGLSGLQSGIEFVFIESSQIGKQLFPVAGIFFLLMGATTLFGTQLTVLDATSRILTENLALLGNKTDGKNIIKTYYSVLWLQIITGVSIFLFGFKEPLQLIIIAAILNAFAMFVHTGLTLWLNLTSLGKDLRPNFARIAVMSLAFVFYGGFCVFVFVDKFF